MRHASASGPPSNFRSIRSIQERSCFRSAGVKLLKTPADNDYADVDVSRHLVPADTKVVLHAGSGGGWRNPFERDPERVRWDVIEDMVSIEAARKHYGVALRDDYSVDMAQTQRLRQSALVEGFR